VSRRQQRQISVGRALVLWAIILIFLGTAAVAAWVLIVGRL
jgi:hypothetical protein